MSTHITVNTYADQERWVDGFAKRDGLKLMFMIGDPGTAKTRTFKTKLDPEQHYYINAARLTPFQLYKVLYQRKNKAIILDDVDDALKRSDMARLLMTLCESDSTARTVAWLGTESLLKTKKGKKVVRIPQEFETTSRVCIICNDWAILTTKFGALLDRGTVVFFNPGAAEIHRYVGDWFKNEEPEIFSFIGAHLEVIPQHSIRYYVNAKEHRRLGLDWKTALLESWTNDEPKCSAAEKLVQQLLADQTYTSDKDRIAAFCAHRDGGSRRTWFNIKKKMALNEKNECQ